MINSNEMKLDYIQSLNHIETNKGYHSVIMRKPDPSIKHNYGITSYICI